MTGFGLGTGRADRHTNGAPGAVIRCHLDGESGVFGEVAPHRGLRLELGRRIGDRLPAEGLHTDRRVRAGQGALTAVDAQAGIPLGQFGGQRPLLQLGGVGRETTTGRHRRDGEQFALAGDQTLHRGQRGIVGGVDRDADRHGRPGDLTDLHLLQTGDGVVDGLDVGLHHRGASLGVGLGGAVLG